MKVSDIQIGDYLYIDAPRPTSKYFGTVVAGGAEWSHILIVEAVNSFGETVERHIHRNYIVHNMTSTVSILTHL